MFLDFTCFWTFGCLETPEFLGSFGENLKDPCHEDPSVFELWRKPLQNPMFVLWNNLVKNHVKQLLVFWIKQKIQQNLGFEKVLGENPPKKTMLFKPSPKFQQEMFQKSQNRESSILEF